MGYSMSMRDMMRYGMEDIAKKKKRKIKVDGKEYDLSEFDDTKSWSRYKK